MVSVIVPVYKSEKTLERCVQSLLDQSFEDMEILLVVDGPPDNSGILADELAKKDARIRVLNQKNRGVSAARNYGLSEAKGEYIRFVDSDDYIPKESMEVLMDAMEKEDTDLVLAGYRHHVFERTIHKDIPVHGSFNLTEEEEQVYRLYYEGFLNMPWNKLYKKELITENFDTNWNLGEDLLFNLAYLKNCKRYSAIPQHVYHYVQNETGSSLSTKRKDDKLSFTIRLYEKVRTAFALIYPEGEEDPVLISKLVKEFLDDLENLAFVEDMTKGEKKNVIREYAAEMQKILNKNTKPYLTKLDYKVIYFFFKRKMTNVTYLFIQLRGFIAKNFI